MLKPGRGDWYLVRVEALADPSGPDLDQGDISPGEISREIDSLLDQMSEMSERELMDMVHRRMVLHLCGPCYRHWIENPTG